MRFDGLIAITVLTSVVLGSPALQAAAPLVTKKTTTFSSNFLNVNNGPLPYRADLAGSGIAGAGTGSSFLEKQIDAGSMSEIYHSMNVQGVRINDLGGAFDVECMFPIASLDDVPDGAFVANDTRWNWTKSDEVFRSILQGGFAPLLKLATREWKSKKWTGQAYTTIDESTNNTTTNYVIPVKNHPDSSFCHLWPAMAPVWEAIGEELVATIVNRYNNEAMWAKDLAVAGLKGPPLEPLTWGNRGFVAVELQNEYNVLECLRSASGEIYTEDSFAVLCGGPAYTWSGRYWDGSPSQAYQAYISQAKRIKTDHPNIRVGGIAVAGKEFSFHLTSSGKEARIGGDAPIKWVKDFFEAIRKANAPFDFFSFHGYTTCETIDGQRTDCSLNNKNSMVSRSEWFRSLLDEYGFNSTEMIISEWNVQFGLNPANSGPGTLFAPAFMSTTLAQLSQIGNKHKLKAAFVVNGIDGAFTPFNSQSFPLRCQEEYSIPPRAGDKAVDYSFTGQWSNRCLFGDSASDIASINGANGMGMVYSNGDLKPASALYSLFYSKFVDKTIVRPSTTAIIPESVGVLAVEDTDKNSSSLLVLLSNASPTESSGSIPPLSELFNLDGAKIFGSSSLIQHIRRLPSVEIPPELVPLLNNGTAGTVQMEGDIKPSTEKYSLDASIELPPSGVLLVMISLD
eukprot:CFRG7457T1